jgi:hypothetical protein
MLRQSMRPATQPGFWQCYAGNMHAGVCSSCHQRSLRHTNALTGRREPSATSTPSLINRLGNRLVAKAIVRHYQGSPVQPTSSENGIKAHQLVCEWSDHAGHACPCKRHAVYMIKPCVLPACKVCNGTCMMGLQPSQRSRPGWSNCFDIESTMLRTRARG